MQEVMRLELFCVLIMYMSDIVSAIHVHVCSDLDVKEQTNPCSHRSQGDKRLISGTKNRS